MGPKHKFAALILVDPAEARRQLAAAYAKNKCHLGDTALAFECGRKALTRWVDALGMREQLRRIEARAVREGWHHARRGGAGEHHNPRERARKAWETRRERAATDLEEAS